jgi:hypothetical protein
MFIAGLPKSGTTWLAQLLAEVPGYRIRQPTDPDGCVMQHNICKEAFAALPRNRYSVVKYHTQFSETNLAAIQAHHLRTVVMYRDLRDQCVSRYFHVLYDPTHRHHRHYNEVSPETGLSHCIEVTLDEYMPWVQRWLPCLSQYPDKFCEVRYEALSADPVGTLSRVIEFYQIRLSPEQVTGIVRQVAGRTKFDLRLNLRRKSGTARKGRVGDWRNHFAEEHVHRFKEVCGQFLVELGYERDLEWHR